MNGNFSCDSNDVKFNIVVSLTLRMALMSHNRD